MKSPEFVKIPRAFFDDHEERDLPTPVVQHRTKNGILIRRDDPAVPELINDAEHYANDGCDCSPALRMSARWTLTALKED